MTTKKCKWNKASCSPLLPEILRCPTVGDHLATQMSPTQTIAGLLEWVDVEGGHLASTTFFCSVLLLLYARMMLKHHLERVAMNTLWRHLHPLCHPNETRAHAESAAFSISMIVSPKKFRQLLSTCGLERYFNLTIMNLHNACSFHASSTGLSVFSRI
jgi:hypothetical protein